MLVADMLRDLKASKISEPVKRKLVEIFNALGIDLRFCRLSWCGRPFVPKKDDHFHCCKKHYEQERYRNGGENGPV